MFALTSPANERRIWIPGPEQALSGLTRRHERGHLVRAVMEGVVLAMRQGLDVMETLGVPLDRIVASGGAVQHPLWLQLQADIYGRRFSGPRQSRRRQQVRRCLRALVWASSIRPTTL